MIKTPLSTVIGGAFWTPKATILGGTSKTFDQLIKSLFANGEQGFAYDPNDLSTMYQDAVGTVPVTGAGQVVGLVLDKSKGLTKSSEILTNGNFDNGFTNWANGNSWWSIVGGRAYHAASSALNALDHLIPTTILGTFLEFDAEVITANSTAVAVAVPSSTILASLNTGIAHYKIGLPAGTTGIQFKRNVSNSAEFYIDNVSVKSVSGNHASQSTASYRPLLKNTPRCVQYDGIDDKLTTTLPAQLTGCTVIRAIPNVGTQILTNQTIPATYNDNTDHCGLIVINRALTATETSQITKLFNKAAGV